MLAYTSGNDHSQRKLCTVRDDEGQHAGDQCRPYGDWAAAGGIDLYEPGGAEGIADKGSQHQQQNVIKVIFQQPVEQCAQEKAQDKAAGGAKQSAEAGIEAGEYGQAHSAHENIQKHGNGAPLAAQKEESAVYGKGLHRKGNYGKKGYVYPGTEAYHDRHQCHHGNILCLHGFYYSFLVHGASKDCRACFYVQIILYQWQICQCIIDQRRGPPQPLKC